MLVPAKKLSTLKKTLEGNTHRIELINIHNSRILLLFVSVKKLSILAAKLNLAKFN